MGKNLERQHAAQVTMPNQLPVQAANEQLNIHKCGIHPDDINLTSWVVGGREEQPEPESKEIGDAIAEALLNTLDPQKLQKRIKYMTGHHVHSQFALVTADIDEVINIDVSKILKKVKKIPQTIEFIDTYWKENQKLLSEQKPQFNTSNVNKIPELYSHIHTIDEVTMTALKLINRTMFCVCTMEKLDPISMMQIYLSGLVVAQQIVRDTIPGRDWSAKNLRRALSDKLLVYSFQTAPQYEQTNQIIQTIKYLNSKKYVKYESKPKNHKHK